MKRSRYGVEAFSGAVGAQFSAQILVLLKICGVKGMVVAADESVVEFVAALLHES